MMPLPHEAFSQKSFLLIYAYHLWPLATCDMGKCINTSDEKKSYTPIASCGKDVPCSAQNEINDTALHLH